MRTSIPILTTLFLLGCHPCDRKAIDFTPLDLGDWPVSTPEAEGLDNDAVVDLYCDAEREETLYGLLVAKGGQLVAEGYYNAGGVDQLSSRQSVTKSFTSALVGVALKQGCLDSVDEKVHTFFPEHDGNLDDPRKRDITIEHLLQMRGGLPDEEHDAQAWDILFSGDYASHFDDIPLVADPGTEHQYANLGSSFLAILTSRACDVDLKEWGQTWLFDPIGAEVGPWQTDVDGYRIGSGGMQITARDMAKFGQLYLDDGEVDGEAVLPPGWVRDSLRSYSSDFTHVTPGPELDSWGYGYQWWSADAGDHHVDFAWGHGGNFIFLERSMDLVVVVTGDPFLEQFDDESWKHEKAHLNMAAAFIGGLE